MFYQATINNRVEIATLLNYYGLVISAAEIGVYRGEFARMFLRRWQGNRMYLIDPWRKLDDYDDIRNIEFSKSDFQYAQSNLRKEGRKVKIIRKTSYEASLDFNDPTLQFVYIDANHKYEYVKQDLEIWWEKLSYNGIIAGHDIIYPSKLGKPSVFTGFTGVTQAVTEFITERKLDCFITPDIPHSFYIQK